MCLCVCECVVSVSVRVCVWVCVCVCRNLHAYSAHEEISIVCTIRFCARLGNKIDRF